MAYFADCVCFGALICGYWNIPFALPLLCPVWLGLECLFLHRLLEIPCCQCEGAQCMILDYVQIVLHMLLFPLWVDLVVVIPAQKVLLLCGRVRYCSQLLYQLCTESCLCLSFWTERSKVAGYAHCYLCLIAELMLSSWDF